MSVFFGRTETRSSFSASGSVAAARAEALAPADASLRVVSAELGTDAGLIGAALVAYEALEAGDGTS